MNKKPKKRGLATLSRKRRLEIARMGGLAVPDHKRAFSKNPDLAVAARALVGKKKRAKRKEKRV